MSDERCCVFPEAGAPQNANRISWDAQAGAVSCAPEVDGDIVTGFDGICVTPVSLR